MQESETYRMAREYVEGLVIDRVIMPDFTIEAGNEPNEVIVSFTPVPVIQFTIPISRPDLAAACFE